MEKRYQVFVSSTYVDLKDERRQVIEALLELDCFPAAMEFFSAADEDQWSFIRRIIDECDYYVVVVGGRYGSVDEATGLSFTEKEYDYAVQKGKPVLGFVHADPASIPMGKSAESDAARQKLEAFRGKVKSRLCRMWRTADELGAVVSRSLTRLKTDRPAEGWVRAGQVTSPEEIGRMQRRIADLEAALEAARTQPPPNVAHLSQGDDTVSLAIESLEATQDAEGEPTDGWFKRESPFRWNDLFRALGPLMFEEANESTLEAHLNVSLFDLVPREDSQESKRLRIPKDTLHTVLIQFFALGLTAKGERRRAAGQSGTYWSLTPYGVATLTKLRAIPRNGI